MRSVRKSLAALIGLAVLAGCPEQGSTGSSSHGGGEPAPLPTSTPAASGTPIERAEAVLRRLVDARCRDPQEPWALLHGAIALGRDVRVGDELALDRYARDHLDPQRLVFPASREGRKVEPHPGYFAKNALELGLPLDHALPARGGASVRLDDLVLAQARAYVPAAQEAPFFDEDWRLELVAAAAERDAAQAARLPALRERALATLVENQAYLEPWLGDAAKAYDKPSTKGADGKVRPAAIHRYVCGGFHFIQAVQRLYGVELPGALARQHRIVRLRLDLEPRYWDEKLAEARRRTQGGKLRAHEQRILAQSLKVLGHGLETWLRAARTGVPVLAATDRAELDRAVERLAGVVLELEALAIFARLDELRARDEQLFLDLIGDGAHALHALALWRAETAR